MIKRLSIEIFKQEIHLFLGEPSEKVVAFAKRRLGTDLSDQKWGSGKTILAGPHRDIIIWTRLAPNRPESLASLVHECAHAARMTLQNVGHCFDPSNDEVFAYTVSHIFEMATRKK